MEKAKKIIMKSFNNNESNTMMYLQSLIIDDMPTSSPLACGWSLFECKVLLFQTRNRI